MGRLLLRRPNILGMTLLASILWDSLTIAQSSLQFDQHGVGTRKASSSTLTGQPLPSSQASKYGHGRLRDCSGTDKTHDGSHKRKQNSLVELAKLDKERHVKSEDGGEARRDDTVNA